MKRVSPVGAAIAILAAAAQPLAAQQVPVAATVEHAKLERRVLFIGGPTLRKWASADPALFAAPSFARAMTSPARGPAAALKDAAAQRPQVVYYLAEPLGVSETGLAREKERTQALLAEAHRTGATVILARPVVFGGKRSTPDDQLAAWFESLAREGRAVYSNPNAIDFHPEMTLARPADLVRSSNGVRGALDAAFRFMPGVPADQQFGRLMQGIEDLPFDEGSGPFRAIAGIDPALPTHTFYRPANLPLFAQKRMPVLVFGNGGCANDAANARPLLTEIASHGYLVIALGQLKSGPGGLARYPDRITIENAPPGKATSAAEMTAAIDWVEKVSTSGEGWGKYVDPTRIAVSGWSCGGLQALATSVDPRVKTTILFNSGLFGAGNPGMPGMDVPKSVLARLHGPAIYLIGGPTDVAYGNARDDFSRIDGVAAYFLSREVGHSGTFWQPHGGAWGRAARLWLDWRLKGDPAARREFSGPDCGLCADPSWTVQRGGKRAAD